MKKKRGKENTSKKRKLRENMMGREELGVTSSEPDFLRKTAFFRGIIGERESEWKKRTSIKRRKDKGRRRNPRNVITLNAPRVSRGDGRIN